MSQSSFGLLRIWERSPSTLPRGPAPPVNTLDEEFTTLLHIADYFSSQETLRGHFRPREAIEPLSLQWFLELEQIRYHRQGRWIPSLLEFGKHQGERLLGLGVGLGSDLIQFARNGSEVVVVSSSASQLSLVRRNFELRGLPGVFLHAGPTAIPVESSSIDVVCLTGLLHETDNSATIIEELYRVLKPGGKVLAVVPAHYDIDHWAKVCWMGHSRSSQNRMDERDGFPISLLSPKAIRFRGRDLRQLFYRFHETRIIKRHLRRADVPHLLRWLPLSLLERVGGRLLVFKGLKPVSAARIEQQAA